MKLTSSTIQQLLITDVPDLDPIRVMIENIDPGRGRITITCFDESWTNYWGAMGNGATIEAFCMRASADYIARKLSSGLKREVHDADAAEAACRAEVLKNRRARDIDKQTASDLWERIGYAEWPDDIQYNGDLFYDVFGDEWWHQLPEKPNHKLRHLLRIVEVVKAGLREHTTPAAQAEAA